DDTRADLDLVISGATDARDESAADGAFAGFGPRGYRWQVGLELSLPWGFRGERAALRQARAGLRQAEGRRALILQTLMFNLRSAWRSLAAARERFTTSEISLELNQEAFERERARFEAGLSTFRDVLEAQSDLDDARLRRLSALSDMVEAEVRLQRLDGRLLERHGFRWENLDERVLTSPQPLDFPTVETILEATE
ncbi:MAG: TolC family protein, partial [Opitutales bacterium]